MNSSKTTKLSHKECLLVSGIMFLAAYIINSMQSLPLLVIGGIMLGGCISTPIKIKEFSKKDKKVRLRIYFMVLLLIILMGVLVLIKQQIKAASP